MRTLNSAQWFSSDFQPWCFAQTDAQEVASVVSAREIQAVAELLQVSPEGLQKAITFKVTVSLRALHPDKGLFLQGHSVPFLPTL